MIQKRRRKLSGIFVAVDAALALFAFLFIYFLKRDTLDLTMPYWKLLLSFLGWWLVISLVVGKFRIHNYHDLPHSLLIILQSNIFILYAMSLMLVLMGLPAFSRLQVFGSCLLLASLEGTVFSIYYIVGGRNELVELNRGNDVHIHWRRISAKLFITYFLIFNFSFFVVNYIKRGHIRLLENYDILLMLMYAFWLVSGVITRKFERNVYRNFVYAISPHLKSAAIMAASMSVVVFGLRLFDYSRGQIFGTYLLLPFLEAAFTFFYLAIYRRNGRQGDVETVEGVRQALRQEKLEFAHRNGNNHHNRPVQPVTEKLENQYLKLNPGLFELIRENINTEKIDRDETAVLSTHTEFNIENLDDNSLDLFINLHRVNDFRYINRYFLEVHRKFYNGGYFVGRADTIHTYHKLFIKKYPGYLARPLYYLNFIYARVLPKLPVVKKLYFVLSGGKNRVISKAELLGRLYFCGFKVVALREIGYSLYYIAQKVKTPSFDRNPSYSPVIRLQRVGYNGDIVQIYKLRTMHPYSEYVQEYVYEHHNLQDNGKFHDDFRLTEWGKLFRKLWIDELPQVVNYLRGDLNLVGVRALSRHYFSLYPKDLQDLRIRFKPGLVPPYYADMPNSFDEIVESERRYLLAKEKHPVMTDVRYLSKAAYNILFHHARSR